jgi:hypothetical protein
MSYEGSLRGSGFYADSADIDDLECKGTIEFQSGAEVDCKFEGTEEVSFDDWGRGVWTCPKCSWQNEYDIPETGE